MRVILLVSTVLWLFWMASRWDRVHPLRTAAREHLAALPSPGAGVGRAPGNRVRTAPPAAGPELGVNWSDLDRRAARLRHLTAPQHAEQAPRAS